MKDITNECLKTLAKYQCYDIKKVVENEYVFFTKPTDYGVSSAYGELSIYEQENEVVIKIKIQAQQLLLIGKYPAMPNLNEWPINFVSSVMRKLPNRLNTSAQKTKQVSSEIKFKCDDKVILNEDITVDNQTFSKGTEGVIDNIVHTSMGPKYYVIFCNHKSPIEIINVSILTKKDS